MSIEIGEMDGRIGGFIIRLACGLSGIVGIAMLSYGLISWPKDGSEYVSIWSALVGDEPYCSFAFGRSIRLGGGFLWKQSPNGMLPALCEVCLSLFALAAALFNRLWMYFIVVALIFLYSF